MSIQPAPSLQNIPEHFRHPVGTRIVCAAIHIPIRRPEGIIVTGARHMDTLMVRQIRDLGISRLPPEAVQGFIDQNGKFYNREEAWAIATAAHQVIRRVGGNEQRKLYSENLY